MGILYGGLEEPAQTKVIKDIYSRPTAITYGLPSGLIQAGIDFARKFSDYPLPEDTLSLEQMIDLYPRRVSEGPNSIMDESNVTPNTISVFNKKD